MEPIDPTAEERLEDFKQRLRESDVFLRETVATLAVEQALCEFNQMDRSHPYKKRRLLRAAGRGLARLGQWLISVAEPQRKEDAVSRQWTVLDSDPFTVDVCPDPFRHRRADSASQGWLLLGDGDEEWKRNGHE